MTFIFCNKMLNILSILGGIYMGFLENLRNLVNGNEKDNKVNYYDTYEYKKIR